MHAAADASMVMEECEDERIYVCVCLRECREREEKCACVCESAERERKVCMSVCI